MAEKHYKKNKGNGIPLCQCDDGSGNWFLSDCGGKACTCCDSTTNSNDQKSYKQNKMKKSELRKIVRKSIKELMNEQPTTGVYHEWQDCSGGYYSGILYWGNSPGNTGVLGTGGSSTQPWATYENSDDFWQFLGQPTPGQVVGIDVNGYNMCLKYIGIVQSGSHGTFGGGDVLLNPTPYTSCNNCEGGNTGISGCTDSNAFNYDLSATINDGNCDYGYRIDAGGCIQCVQYHPSCIYTTPNCDDGSQSSTSGCMDSTATNYNASATVDDGSCQYDNTQTDTCCDWCQTANFQQSIPPTGCMDWMCTDPQWISDYCPDLERGAPTIGRDPEIDRMRDLAFRGRR